MLCLTVDSNFKGFLRISFCFLARALDRTDRDLGLERQLRAFNSHVQLCED